MKYVYHKVPKNMVGNFLYPLNQLEEILPEIYNQQVKKYFGRVFLMEEKIPMLNCKWNDVLHFAPICPQIISKNLKEIGHQTDNNKMFFKIPISKFNHKATVIFHYTREDAELLDSEISNLNIEDFEELKELPIGTKNWYIECYKNGRSPLLYHRVPHILTLDSIDISDCEKILW